MKTALRLTADAVKNLSALSGVAYMKLGAIFPSPSCTQCCTQIISCESPAQGVRFGFGKYSENSLARGTRPNLIPAEVFRKAMLLIRLASSCPINQGFGDSSGLKMPFSQNLSV